MLLVAAGGCGRAERSPERTGAAPGAGDVAAVASGAAAAKTSSAAAAPDAKPPCPADGRWKMCNIIERLDRAGLAPRLDSGTVRVERLTLPGARLHIGTSELEVFLYPDTPSRERDEARLDKSAFVESSAEPGMRREPTLIRNANVLAILHSVSAHQRERVSDAITAGPPQSRPETR